MDGPRILSARLAPADIRLDGRRPWDISVREPRFFSRVLRGGSLALGETYEAGWWECERLDELFFRLIRSGLARAGGWPTRLARRLAAFRHPGRRSRAFEIGRRHYDLGNDLFEAMLDRRLTYSCAYWCDASDLDAAQEAKLDLVCRKIRLRPGMRVLDVGSGWGSFALFAAEQYGASVVGVTVSREQVRLAQSRAGGLPVEYRLADYRDLDERFDAIVSIGMFEHVGAASYPVFFDVIRRCLAPGGLFLLHTIGAATASRTPDPWISRYIFPNSHLPGFAEIADAIDGRFLVEDWQNFGADYEKTLLSWERNFSSSWPRLAPRYGEPFRRRWRYYLLSCAGAFRARFLQLWQIVLSSEGVPGGYAAVR